MSSRSDMPDGGGPGATDTEAPREEGLLDATREPGRCVSEQELADAEQESGKCAGPAKPCRGKAPGSGALPGKSGPSLARIRCKDVCLAIGGAGCAAAPVGACRATRGDGACDRSSLPDKFMRSNTSRAFSSRSAKGSPSLAPAGGATWLSLSSPPMSAMTLVEKATLASGLVGVAEPERHPMRQSSSWQ